MKNIKLSKPQNNVILLMINGYELGVTGFYHKKIPSHTIESLFKLKLIKFKKDSIFLYELTEFGKSYNQCTK